MEQADASGERPGGHLSDQTTEETARLVAEAADHSSLAGIHEQCLQSPNDSYTEQPQSEPSNAPAPMSSLATIPSDSVSPSGSVSSSSGIEALADADNQAALKTAEHTSTPHGGEKPLDSHDDRQYATSATTDASVASGKTPAANPLRQSRLDAHKPVTPVGRHESEFTTSKRPQPYSQRVRQQPNTAVRFTATARNIPTMTPSDQYRTPTLDSHVADVSRGAQGHELGEPQSPLPLTTTHQHVAPPQATWSAVEVDQNQYVQWPPLPNQAPGDFSMPGTVQYPMYTSVPYHASFTFTGQGNQFQHPQALNFIRPPEAHLYVPAFSQTTPSGIPHLPPQLNPYLSSTPAFYQSNPLMTSVGQYPAVPPYPTSYRHSLHGNQLVQPPIPVHGTVPPPVIVTPPSPAVISQPVSQPALVSQQAEKQNVRYRRPHSQKAPSRVSGTDPRAVPSTRVSLPPAPQPAMVPQQTEQQHASYTTPYFQTAPSRVSGTDPRALSSAAVSLRPVPQAAMSSQQAEQQHGGYRTPYLQVTPPCVSRTDPRPGKSPGGSFQPAPEPAMVSQQRAGYMTPYFQIAPPCVGGTDSRHRPSPGASFEPVPQPAVVSQQADEQHAVYRTPYFRGVPPRTSPTNTRPEQCATDDAHSTGRVTGSRVMAALQKYKAGCLRIREDMLENTRSLLRQLKDADGAHSQADSTRPRSTQSKTDVISQVMAMVEDYVSKEGRLSATMFDTMSSFLKSVEGSHQVHPRATTDFRHASNRSPMRAARYKNRLYMTDVPRRFACKEEGGEQREAAASTVTTCDHHRSDNSEMTRECDAIVSALERLLLQTPQEYLLNPEERTPDILRPVHTESASGATSGRRRLQEFQRLCPSNPEAEQDNTVACQPAASAERPQPQRGRGRGRTSPY